MDEATELSAFEASLATLERSAAAIADALPRWQEMGDAERQGVVREWEAAAGLLSGLLRFGWEHRLASPTKERYGALKPELRRLKPQMVARGFVVPSVDEPEAPAHLEHWMYEVVETTRDDPVYGVPKGAVGTVLYIHPNSEVGLVEIDEGWDDDGVPVVDLPLDSLRLWEGEGSGAT